MIRTNIEGTLMLGNRGGGKKRCLMFLMLAVQYVAGTPMHYLPYFDACNGSHRNVLLAHKAGRRDVAWKERQKNRRTQIVAKAYNYYSVSPLFFYADFYFLIEII